MWLWIWGNFVEPLPVRVQENENKEIIIYGLGQELNKKAIFLKGKRDIYCYKEIKGGNIRLGFLSSINCNCND